VARILVVDDESTIRALVAALLSARGHQVTPLADGAELLETMAREHPDLILLDIQLPGKDGFALLAEIRNTKGDEPRKVVALSAGSGADETDRIRSAGFDGFIAKPIAVREFAAEVARYLG
jgi:two-component system, cell cycle response regulator DivK